MTDLLDSDDFIELMKAYRDSGKPKTSEEYVSTAFEDVKNYIRIHCVVPGAEPLRLVIIDEEDKSAPF